MKITLTRSLFVEFKKIYRHIYFVCAGNELDALVIFFHRLPKVKLVIFKQCPKTLTAVLIREF